MERHHALVCGALLLLLPACQGGVGYTPPATETPISDLQLRELYHYARSTYGG